MLENHLNRIDFWCVMKEKMVLPLTMIVNYFVIYFILNWHRDLDLCGILFLRKHRNQCQTSLKCTIKKREYYCNCV